MWLEERENLKKKIYFIKEKRTVITTFHPKKVTKKGNDASIMKHAKEEYDASFVKQR